MCPVIAENFCRCYLIRHAGRGVGTPGNLHGDLRGLGSAVSPELFNQFPAPLPSLACLTAFSLLLKSGGQEEEKKKQKHLNYCYCPQNLGKLDEAREPF